MKQLMEYHIISGRVIETRRVYMACRDGKKKTRGTRIAGNTSAKKIALNERDAVKRFARTLNANFGMTGFLWVTLKYSDKRLPASYLSAQDLASAFLNKARKAYKREMGKSLRYALVTANWNQQDKREARLHHHLVVDPDMSLDLLSKLWPEGEFYVRRVSNPGDLTGLAAYMIENVRVLDNERGIQPGKKKYTVSKGMAEPIRTDPQPVKDIEGLQPLLNCAVLGAEPTYDEDGRLIGSYLRTLAPEQPKVRGSMVILPKRRTRRVTWDEGYLAEIRRQDK